MPNLESYSSKSEQERKLYFERVRQQLRPSSLSDELDEQHLLRVDEIILKDKDLIENKKVLELGSGGHGIFSRALLHAGASHVTAIEIREEHLRNFENSPFGNDLPKDKFTFICADQNSVDQIFAPGSFETVLFSGVFYHIHNHIEILQKLHKMRFQNLILDTAVISKGTSEPILLLEIENSTDKWNGLESGNNCFLSGIPNRAAVDLMLAYTKWKTVRTSDYSHFIVAGPMQSLSQGRRLTLTCQYSDVPVISKGSLG